MNVSLLQRTEDNQPTRPSICSLPPPDLRERRAEIQTFLQRATRIAALPDGLELEFEGSSDLAHALTGFIHV